LYFAFAVAAFATILAMTGAVVAFETELDHIFHWKLSYVVPMAATLSLADIGRAGSTSFPGETVRGYEFGEGPDLSYRVRFASGIAFVNPYTGEVLGTRTTPDASTIFLRTVHRIHIGLIPSFSEVGGKVLSWASAGVIFLLISGLYLWWPIRRLLPDIFAKGRPFWLELHNASGVLAMPFILLLAVTGMMIGFNQTAVPMVFRITGFQAPPVPSLPPTIPWDRPISPDEAVERARAALPGAAPFDINMPAALGHYQIRLRYPEDRTPGGRSHVVVDQYSGSVLVAQSSRTAPAATRILNANRAIHTGDVFGLSSKLAMALSSLMLVVQVVTGGIMWWKRSGLLGKRRSR
jgi:uncharacterized iron-regulated membrane protein